jgi:hypothetical protein
MVLNSTEVPSPLRLRAFLSRTADDASHQNKPPQPRTSIHTPINPVTQMSLSNPLNTLLIPPILYLLYLILFPAHPQSPKKLPTEYSPDEYNWLPAQHPPVTCYKRFGPRELSKYDGKGQGPEGQRILLAIMRIGRDGKVPQAGKIQRTVFDVSNGRNFYGPGT